MSDAVAVAVSLPVGAKGRNSVGWWGMLCLIGTEASLFAYLLFSYFFIALQRGAAWSPVPHPSLKLAGPNTLILLLSSVAVWQGEEGAKAGQRDRQLGGLAAGIGLGLAFLVVQAFEWRAKSYSLSSGSYGSLYFTITGFHMAHVIAGLLMLSAVLIWSAMGIFNPRRHAPVSIASIYWHFVDVVWLAVFATFYVSPYVMW